MLYTSRQNKENFFVINKIGPIYPNTIGKSEKTGTQFLV